jgi:hypothetical protein
MWDTPFALLSSLSFLRQVDDRGFCVFRGNVGMACFPMLNGCFQMCDSFVHMRKILACVEGVLQCSFRMSHELRHVTLFTMLHRFCRVLEGVRVVLLFMSHNVTPRPALAEYRLHRQHRGGD